jgi:uncharacterized phage protein gp47/JayE
MADLTFPTPAELRDGILRRVAYSYQRQGLTANILPGSDRYITAEAVASRLSIPLANSQTANTDRDPLNATGQALEDLAEVYGVTKRDASKAAGYVTVTITGTATIPAAFRCTAPDGQKYDTTTTTVGAITGTKVEVQAVEGGEASNQDADVIMTWDSTSIGNLKQTAVVDAGELDGGADADDDETLRQRLLDRLSFPQGGGNDAQVKAWAEEASAAVDKAYVYPAVRGAGSFDIAVTAEGGDRTLASATVAEVAAYVRGKVPGGSIDVNVTTVAPQAMDIIVYLSLPLPQNAGGAGGGWRDGTPWPSGSFAAGTNDGKVTSYSAPTATVRTTTAPVVGNQIGIWNPTNKKMYEYTVTVVGGVSGAYTIQVQDSNGATGFKVSPLDAYVSAGAYSLATYADDLAEQIELLGPGEKTTNTDILPRGRRFPGTDVSNPSDLTSKLLSVLDREHEEILNITYAGRLITLTTTPQTSPTTPATTADPPSIFSLAYLSFWPS